jgi:hypothetical protein
MRRLSACLLFASLLTAQELAEQLAKAPPDVEEALRSRVAKFFQANMEKKYGLATTYVADDSKDAYIGSDKIFCHDLDIARITYSENFTKANVLLSCDTDFIMATSRTRVKMPRTWLWKVENGQWFWYVLPTNGELATPFGIMRPGPADGQAPAPALPRIPSPEELMGKIQVDKPEVRLSSYQPVTDEVLLSNGTPGQISISLEHDPVPGLTVKLERPELKAGEKSRITFECHPVGKGPKETLMVRIRVQPFSHAIPIRVLFEIPPEVQKQIPASVPQRPTTQVPKN